MTLANKYLRYSSEITLDIFELVWNKLIEFGFKSRYDNKLYSEFKAFRNRHNYLTIDDTHFNTVMSFCIINELETTVQEILGYDPFVKKEVIPEYVELLEGFDSTCTGKIFDTNQPIPQMNGWSNQWTWESIFKNDIQRPYFKSSTKEAFDVQNQPKPIEKWSVGSYGVVINSTNKRFPIGFIDKIISAISNKKVEFENYNSYDPENLQYSYGLEFKWFATKTEAEEFAKTLIEPTEETKRPLKQAVHCKTQEEWDFITEKLGYKWLESRFENYKKNSCIGIQIRTNGHISEFINNYQILSFQEWCDLNEYKMESNQEFKVGDWVVNLDASMNYKINEICKISLIEDGKIACEGKPTSRSNQKDFKCFRHATPEEIINHLISTQIPAGEPLNTGIEPNKDGMFKYKHTILGASWSGGTIDNHLDVMIPTTGNSYNKDFSTSIIPVKSISAEVEFNYLPEPK